MKWAAVIALLLPAPATARDALGVHDGWGAFRDARPPRCFAIAEPMRKRRGAWKAFASIAHWPTQRVRGQLHVRLSRERRADAAVMLTIDGRGFPLVGGRVDAWAPDARSDAAIVAAMRSGRVMTVMTASAAGGRFADSYALKGAATAIDAAALGCARRR